MKLLMILMFLSSFSAFAQRNPQIRVCNLNGGRFWSLDITKPADDNIGFCRYNNSLIGSLSLIQHFHFSRDTFAMKAYKESARIGYSSCFDAGATTIIGTDSEGGSWDICQFKDYSFVLERTLTEGFYSPFNQSLSGSL